MLRLWVARTSILLLSLKQDKEPSKPLSQLFSTFWNPLIRSQKVPFIARVLNPQNKQLKTQNNTFLERWARLQWDLSAVALTNIGQRLDGLDWARPRWELSAAAPISGKNGSSQPHECGYVDLWVQSHPQWWILLVSTPIFSSYKRYPFFS